MVICKYLCRGAALEGSAGVWVLLLLLALGFLVCFGGFICVCMYICNNNEEEVMNLRGHRGSWREGGNEVNVVLMYEILKKS